MVSMKKSKIKSLFNTVSSKHDTADQMPTAVVPMSDTSGLTPNFADLTPDNLPELITAAPFLQKAGPEQVTYGHIASLLWPSLAAGIIFSYGGRFGFTLISQAFLFAFSVCLLAFYMTRLRLILCRDRFLVAASGIFLLAGLMGWWRSEQVIGNYEKISTFYYGAPAQIGLLVQERTAVVPFGDREMLRLEGQLQYVQPHKEKKAIKIPGEGNIIAYVQAAAEKQKHQVTADGREYQSVTDGRSYKPAPGDEVVIEGKIYPRRFLPEEGRVDLRARYITASQTGVIYDGKLTGGGEYHSSQALSLSPAALRLALDRKLNVLRSAITEKIKSHIPGQSAELLEGLLFGGNYSRLEEGITKSFASTGLIHILSVSGSHISLLFAFVYGMARLARIRRDRAAVPAVLLILWYCLLTGFSPPVFRAALTGTIAAFGVVTGRDYQARQALAASACLFLLLYPLLLFDVSFQLSYAASYGIALYLKPWYRSLIWLPPFIRAPLVLTGAAQVFALPLQLYYFHMLSLTAFAANMLVAPLLDLMIIGGAVMLLAAFLVPFLPGWGMLELLGRAALFLTFSLAGLPGGAWWVGAPNLAELGGYYSVVVLANMKLTLKGLWKRQTCMKPSGMNLLGINLSSIRLPSVRLPVLLILALVLLICQPYFLPAGSTGKWLCHIIPITTGKSFLLKQLDGPERLLYVDGEARKVTPRMMQEIKNSLHYHGVNRLTLFVADGIAPENRQELLQLRSYFQVNKQIQAPPKELQILQEKGGRHSIYLLSAQGAYLFCNGQNGKKLLQLMDRKKAILTFGDSRETASWLLEREQRQAGRIKLTELQVIYWPRFGRAGDIDPGEENLYAAGAAMIPTFVF